MSRRTELAAAHYAKFDESKIARDDSGKFASTDGPSVEKLHQTHQSLAKNGIGGRKPMSLDEFKKHHEAKNAESDRVSRETESGLKKTEHDSHLGELVKSAKVKASASTGDVPAAKGDESGSVRLSLKLADGTKVSGRLHFKASRDSEASEFSFDPDEEEFSPELQRKFADSSLHEKSVDRITSAKLAKAIESSGIVKNTAVMEAIEKTRKRNRMAEKENYSRSEIAAAAWKSRSSG